MAPIQSILQSRYHGASQPPQPQPEMSETQQARKASTISLPATYKPAGGEAHVYEVDERNVEEVPYFGQVVNSFDLVANNIEKAVEAMR